MLDNALYPMSLFNLHREWDPFPAGHHMSPPFSYISPERTVDPESEVHIFMLKLKLIFGDSIALLRRQRIRTEVSKVTSLYRLMLYAVIEWRPLVPLWVLSHFEMMGWGIGGIQTVAITKSITKS